MRQNYYKIFALALFGVLCFLFYLPSFASNPCKDVSFSSGFAFFYNAPSAISKTESPTVDNSSEYAAEEPAESEKILVVLVDSYGIQNYSKVVITDVNMELSILIAKDIFGKIPMGIYTVVASSANDLISQKLIIQ